MQSPDYAIGGAAFIVLDKFDMADSPVELPPGERLEKIAAPVIEQFRFNDDNTFYVSLYDIHVSASLRRYCPYWFFTIGAASSLSFSRVIQPIS